MANDLAPKDGETTLGAGAPINQLFGLTGAGVGPLGAIPATGVRAISRQTAATSGAPSNPGGGGGGGGRGGQYRQY